MTPATTFEETTQPRRWWSAVEETQTPDLMRALKVAQDIIAMGQHGFEAAAASVDPGVAARFDAVFEWAMRQDFDADYAARVRREAWGRPETQ